MSRALIEKAMKTDDAHAALVQEGLTALRILDPAEYRRASVLLNEAKAFYNDGTRGGQFDKFFQDAGSLNSAIGQVAAGYHANEQDTSEFIDAVNAVSDVEAGFLSLDDIYGPSEGGDDNADTDNNADDTAPDGPDSESENADGVDSGVGEVEAAGEGVSDSQG